MSFPPHIWAQLKSITVEDLCRALDRDQWSIDTTGGGSMRIYRHAASGRRVSIHFHPGKTYSPKLLQGLLKDIGWGVDDLRRVRLVK